MSKKLPTAPGSVVFCDGYLIKSRFGNWVSEGVFIVEDKDLAKEAQVEVIFDANE